MIERISATFLNSFISTASMQDDLALDKETAQTLSKSRIREAEVLFERKEFSGAYYLAGYSIELAIKAVICKRFKSETIPDRGFILDLYTHKLRDLIKISGLKDSFEKAQGNNPELEKFWGIVSTWTENSRYEIKTEQDASALIEAINNQKNEILAWINRHW